MRVSRCLLGALRTSYTPSSVRSHARGIRVQTGSSELKLPWKSAAVSPASMPRADCQQKGQETVGPCGYHSFLMKPLALLIGPPGLEMHRHTLCPCQEEVWPDPA